MNRGGAGEGSVGVPSPDIVSRPGSTRDKRCMMTIVLISFRSFYSLMIPMNYSPASIVVSLILYLIIIFPLFRALKTIMLFI